MSEEAVTDKGLAVQRGRCSGSSNELRSAQNNDKILKFPVWFESFKGKEHC